MSTVEKRVFKIPADGHGAVYVEGETEEEAWEWVQENDLQISPSEANLSMDVDPAYRERVEEVDPEEIRRAPINAESSTENTLTRSVENSIPQFPHVGELRAARTRLDLTQAEVAEEMGVSAKTISHYEQGTREITLSRAREYEAALRRSL